MIFSFNQGCNKARVYPKFLSRKINRYATYPSGCAEEPKSRISNQESESKSEQTCPDPSAPLVYATIC